jgi:hemoglobin
MYEQLGGQAFFDRLVDAFYDAVESEPALRVLYPDDLRDARRHLALFLGQYWGGPAAYSAERGHPRLRQRHEPFAIDARIRDLWLTSMTTALASVRGALTDDQFREMTDYFAMAARQLRNV